MWTLTLFNCCLSNTIVATAVLLALLALPVYYMFLHHNRKPVPVVVLARPKELDSKLYSKKITSYELNIGDKINCYDPSTGDYLGDVLINDEGSISGKVDKAREAQIKWSQSSFEERRRVLRCLLNFVLNNQDDICRVASRDSGKTMIDGSFGEILTTCEKLRWTISDGERCLKPEVRSSGLLMAYKQACVYYEPIGVVGSIVSWNYPFHNVLGPIISAIFSGNAIIVKCSEYVAWSAFNYYEPLIKQVLVSCGHSPDLVSFVYGFAEQGQLLIDRVDKLTFIGSPGVGKLVMARAANTLTPVVLELGGKDVAVVCEDADLTQVLELVMRGTFQNCGQNCIGLERLLVHEAIYDSFVAKVHQKVSNLTTGSTNDSKRHYDCGAMTMPSSLARIEHLIAISIEQEAKLLVGGHPLVHPDFPGGVYFEPTLLIDVKPHMAIAQEEVFGPVMAIYKFTTDDEAIQLTNTSPFGLGSNVFTSSTTRFHYIMSRLKVGMCNHNDFAVSYLCQSLPFGGVKTSGFDRFAGSEGLRGNCQLKAVTTDRVSFIKTYLPSPLQYPINSSAFLFSTALIHLVYNNSLSTKIKAIIDLIKNSL